MIDQFVCIVSPVLVSIAFLFIYLFVLLFILKIYSISVVAGDFLLAFFHIIVYYILLLLVGFPPAPTFFIKTFLIVLLLEKTSLPLVLTVLFFYIFCWFFFGKFIFEQLSKIPKLMKNLDLWNKVITVVMGFLFVGLLSIDTVDTIIIILYLIS